MSYFAKKNVFTALCVILTALWSGAWAQTLSYYLPSHLTYDASVPTPKQVLGHEVGEWHANSFQIVTYMKELARSSKRIQLKTYGQSYESRELLTLIITSEANQARLEDIRKMHLKLSDPTEASNVSISDMPVVVWLGYSVHGNEPSGANAALLTAYYLAAAQGVEIDNLLKNTVIILDPCINPDGTNRFATWVNAHKSQTPVSHPMAREFHEPFPKGRFNHYWFDLNRDWLPLQLSESQGRVARFHEWKPNVLTDHHEMGSDKTFFFQPGVPERDNPLTPPQNRELALKLARKHADFLNKIGSLYYTEEDFDDFFYGKGSTYPDINACVGILFEQASSRGHAQSTVHGLLEFPFTIKNQFIVSLSTLAASLEMREELLNYQKNFYTQAQNTGALSTEKAYIFGSSTDSAKNYHFIEVLKRHQIKVYKTNNDFKINDLNFKKHHSYVVPLAQAQYRTIQAIFKSESSFKDSLFYDISAWTFPMAFDIPYASLGGKSLPAGLMGEELIELNMPKGHLYSNNNKQAYSYVFEWNGYYAPRLLNELLQEELIVKVCHKKFKAETSLGTREFGHGSILVPLQNQNMSPLQIKELLTRLVQSNAVSVFELSDGLTPEGADLGSTSHDVLRPTKVLLVVGEGVAASEAGEIWHLLDTRYKMPVTMLEMNKLGSIDLSEFQVLVMADGNYGGINNAGEEAIKKWLKDGNTLIAMQGALKWVKNKEIANFHSRDLSSKDTLPRPYEARNRDRGAQEVGGSIFKVQIDLTHPLCYGYQTPQLHVFRNTSSYMSWSENPYATPIRYGTNPLVAGYLSERHKKAVENTAGALIKSSGRGRVVLLADNPNFRAFWYGTNKIFMNAVFFGHLMQE
ncbi:MAG: zinc carboxypeptidase [Cytophagales bacterium]|nr:MAG: zinc carboxypeptidase [Cytophagales bacterium]TAF59403.1 MAG: zinc carboxypeptidase [Cytophagales bacterium]